MIKINNQKLEQQIKEILQNSKFSSVDEYLHSRVAADYVLVKRGASLRIC